MPLLYAAFSHTIHQVVSHQIVRGVNVDALHGVARPSDLEHHHVSDHVGIDSVVPRL